MASCAWRITVAPGGQGPVFRQIGDGAFVWRQGWQSGNANWAAEVCLRAWLVQRGGIGAGEHERGIAAVVGFIERHGTSRFADWEALGEPFTLSFNGVPLIPTRIRPSRNFEVPVPYPSLGAGRW